MRNGCIVLFAVIVGLAYVHGRDIATLTGVDDVIIDYAQSRPEIERTGVTTGTALWD